MSGTLGGVTSKLRESSALQVDVSSNPDWCQEWEELVRRVIIHTLMVVKEDEDTEVSVLLVDNAAIRDLNRTYRGVDRATDVLSFAQREGEDALASDPLLGDVVISIERAQEQALEYGHSPAREVGFLAVHGTLHLLGFDHVEVDDERVMMEKTEAILASAGLSRETR